MMYSIDGYNCKAENLKVENETVAVTNVVGAHLHGKGNENVEVLYIPSTNCIRNLPAGISKFFANLKKIQVSEGSFKYISRNDFSGLNLIKKIEIRNTLLSTIPQDTFNDMEKLETLILSDNNIKKLELGTFAKLSSLRKVSLDGNLLENVPAKLFENNSRVGEIHLSHNRLSVIDPHTFSHLKDLYSIALDNNFCISKSFPNDCSLTELLVEISSKCTSGAELVESSVIVEMRHELLALQQNVSFKAEKIRQLEEDVSRQKHEIDELESEKIDLINEVADIRNCSTQIESHNETADILITPESSKLLISTAFLTSTFVLIMLLIVALAISISLLVIKVKRRDIVIRSNDTEMKINQEL